MFANVDAIEQPRRRTRDARPQVTYTAAAVRTSGRLFCRRLAAVTWRGKAVRGQKVFRGPRSPPGSPDYSTAIFAGDLRLAGAAASDRGILPRRGRLNGSRCKSAADGR